MSPSPHFLFIELKSGQSTCSWLAFDTEVHLRVAPLDNQLSGCLCLHLGIRRHVLIGLSASICDLLDGLRADLGRETSEDPPQLASEQLSAHVGETSAVDVDGVAAPIRLDGHDQP